MPLLNYTTQISADKTVAEIQKKLAMFGAKRTMAEYDDSGNIVALSFQIEVKGNLVGYRLPADYKPVLVILLNDPNVTPKLQTDEQAIRVSWRILKDWIEAQLALLETQMVEPEQLFLPYMMQGDRTLYERMVESNFLLGEKETE